MNPRDVRVPLWTRDVLRKLPPLVSELDVGVFFGVATRWVAKWRAEGRITPEQLDAAGAGLYRRSEVVRLAIELAEQQR